MSAVIRWEDPPARYRGRTKKGEGDGLDHAAIAEVLKAHPKRWAVVKETERETSTTAWEIARGVRPEYLPSGSFESCSRRIDGAGYAVFARYVGDQP